MFSFLQIFCKPVPGLNTSKISEKIGAMPSKNAKINSAVVKKDPATSQSNNLLSFADKSFSESYIKNQKLFEEMKKSIKYIRSIVDEQGKKHYYIKILKNTLSVDLNISKFDFIFLQQFNVNQDIKVLGEITEEFKLEVDLNLYTKYSVNNILVHSDGFTLFIKEQPEGQNVILDKINLDRVLRGSIDRMPITFDVTHQSIGYKRGLLALLFGSVQPIRLLAVSYESFDKEFYFYFLMDIDYMGEKTTTILQISDAELYLSSGFATYFKLLTLEEYLSSRSLCEYNSISTMRIKEDHAIYCVFVIKDGKLKKYILESKQDKIKILYEFPASITI